MWELRIKLIYIYIYSDFKFAGLTGLYELLFILFVVFINFTSVEMVVFEWFVLPVMI
jgi:hypothetical protein